ncbi:Prolyl-tRNA synthetase 2, partial [mine drainage metagenome]
AATGRVAANLAAFARMAAAFGLPFLAIRRPEWDKFAGAYYSVALDIPIGAGRTLQIGSVHHYRENFARPYGIRFEAADGSTRYVHQTTFGLSERLLGAVLAVHGDDRGAVFPRALAPFEVVIVPIPSAAAGDLPQRTAAEVARRLEAAGRRVRLDDGPGRPGAKYYHWELLGAPLRLEIGAREAAAQQLAAVDRLG